MRISHRRKQANDNHLPWYRWYHAAVADPQRVVFHVHSAWILSKHLPSPHSSADDKVMSCRINQSGHANSQQWISNCDIAVLAYAHETRRASRSTATVGCIRIKACIHVHINACTNTSPSMVRSAPVRGQFATEIRHRQHYDIIPEALCLHFRHKILQRSVDSLKFCIDFFSIVVVLVPALDLSGKAGSLQGPIRHAMNGLDFLKRSGKCYYFAPPQIFHFLQFGSVWPPRAIAC